MFHHYLIRIGGLAALGLILASLPLRSEPVFSLAPIETPLLRQQSILTEEGPHHYVNNYDLESALDLASTPEQAAVSSYTGKNYLLWNFSGEADREIDEASITFIILPKVAFNGSLDFGLGGPDHRWGSETGPQIALRYNRHQSAKLAFWSDEQVEKADWRTIPGFTLKLAVTYRAVIQLNKAKTGTWDLTLTNSEGDLLAAKTGIPYRDEWLTRFSHVFLRSDKNPVLIKEISLRSKGQSVAQALFADSSAFHPGTGLSKHPGWSINSTEFDFQVVPTKPLVEKILVASPRLSVALSKDHYEAEDSVVEGVITLPARRSQWKNCRLSLRVRAPDGSVIAERADLAVPGNQLGFSWEIPGEAPGRSLKLEVTLADQKSGVTATAGAPFQVAPPAPPAQQGRVAIHLPGRPDLAGAVIPQAVGVPFPKGALQTGGKLRLVDEAGKEVEAAFQIDGRWSRFGSIRWLKCFFSLPVPEQDRKLFLEFGPEGRSPDSPDPVAGQWDGTFSGKYVQVGKEVISGRAESTGEFRPLLKSTALGGAYLIDGTGQLFSGNTRGDLEVERSNGEQLVLRHRGWYQGKENARFCKFDNRVTFFRNAPFARIEHAWIFTGDGNRETIREMGWRFDTVAPTTQAEFYLGAGGWSPGQYLLQYAPRKAALQADGHERELDQGTLGLFRARAGLSIGVKDFWQNFPGELVADKNALSVLTWPRHGRQNTEEITVKNSYKLPFIHAGAELNFRLPEPYLQKPIYSDTEKHYQLGDAESANAQGIAKTTEMWLYFGDARDSGPLIGSLMERQLSAYVDPAWLADSQVFHEIAARDAEKFPEDEALYEAVALAPARWAERMDVYGKWIWGGVLSTPDLANQNIRGTFRAFRKAHQGWPYSWLSYARSGDNRFRQFAEASTRNMADVSFCHYSDDRAPRPLGFWNRSLIPWTFIYGPTSRHYADKVDYLWHAWHLADDYRAKDAALTWEQATKTDRMEIFPWSGGRRTVNMLKTYVEAFQESGDPWFISAYREVAALHKAQNQGRPPEKWTLEKATFWSTGPQEYTRFTGDEEYTRLYRNYADYWGGEKNENVWTYYGYLPLAPLAGAWQITREPYYAKRIRGVLDWARLGAYDGEEEWFQGYNPHAKQGNESAVLFAGYFLQQYPFAAKVLAGMAVEGAIPSNAFVLPGNLAGLPKGEQTLEYPTIYFRKLDKPVSLDLRLLYASGAELAHPWKYNIAAVNSADRVAGEWLAKKDADLFTIDLPETAAPGEYKATITHTFTDPGRYRWGSGPALMMPLTPTGTPEVIAWPRGSILPAISCVSQLWFKWPDGEDTLRLTFAFNSLQDPVQNPKVLNGARTTVWKESFPSSKEVKNKVITCELRRGDFGPDGMVHVSFPGPDIRWSVEGEGMLYFALSPERWFQPSAVLPGS
jgi:hypothetical protein